MSRLVVTHLPASPRALWLEARRADVTASEVAALYGRHKYLTRLQLAYNKIYGERDSGGKPDVAKRRGNILEPACAAAVELDHGLAPRKVRHYLRGRDPANPLVRVGATLDYEIDADGGDLLDALDKAKVPHGWGELDGLPVRLACECKSVDRDIFDSEWADGPPVYHVYQALVQAMLGDYDGAIIAALVVNFAHDLHLYTVPRDLGLETKILADIAGFWGELDEGQLPAAEARDNKAMAKYTRPVDGSFIDLRGDATWELALEEREVLKRRIGGLEYEVDAIEARLKETLGDHTAALVDGWSVTWKADRNGKRTLRIDRRAS